jgi:Protein of unknown function (DUF3147)
MKVFANLSAVFETKPHEYATRFVFGGCVTVLAGIIAKKYGPVFGGLFLAFPAIFPAGATLISKHEKEKKHVAGKHGSKRGRRAAGVDAAGAAIGAIGLLVFALLAWKLGAYCRGRCCPQPPSGGLPFRCSLGKFGELSEREQRRLAKRHLVGTRSF